MPAVTVMGHALEVSAETEAVLVRPVIALFDHVMFYMEPATAACFLEIYECDAGGREYVVSPDFQRHSPEHRLYRELRHNLLIRPRGGGQWEAGKGVEVCVFSHMLYAHAAGALRDRVAGHAPPDPVPSVPAAEVSR